MSTHFARRISNLTLSVDIKSKFFNTFGLFQLHFGKMLFFPYSKYKCTFRDTLSPMLVTMYSFSAADIRGCCSGELKAKMTHSNHHSNVPAPETCKRVSMRCCKYGKINFPIGRGLNSNPPFFLCLNTSFVFTNYQPIQRNASYNRTVRIMHRYCIIQHEFYVSNTIY